MAFSTAGFEGTLRVRPSWSQDLAEEELEWRHQKSGMKPLSIEDDGNDDD